MAHKIALTSNGPLSGKTTLADYLGLQHGFMVASHSLTIVKGFVQTHNEQHRSGLTVEQVYADKERYRIGLQEWGNENGFNSTDKTVYWVKKTLAEWMQYKPERDVVFSETRGEGQAEVLRDMGFTIVQLEINEVVRRLRAAKEGKDIFKIWAAMDEHPELERGIKYPDISLDATQPPDMLARVILSVPPRAREAVSIFGHIVYTR